MKSKKIADAGRLPVMSQNITNKIEAQPIKSWRLIGARLAAVFLIIVFLASECAALLPAN